MHRPSTSVPKSSHWRWPPKTCAFHRSRRPSPFDSKTATTASLATRSANWPIAARVRPIHCWASFNPAPPRPWPRATASPKRCATTERPVTYPESALAQRLKTIAQLIDAGLKTRVYYVELDGFDTHSQQPAAHAALLQQFGDAVRAFVDDVAHHGHGNRTLVMSFSEFGRRVAENASQGTDHGAAAPMFLAGSRVRAGLVGEHPSLDDLEDGDVKFHTDFRQVYATLLERWLGWSSKSVLGGDFKPIDALTV